MGEKKSLIATIDYLAERVIVKHGEQVAESAFNTNRSMEEMTEGELWDILGNLQQMDTD